MIKILIIQLSALGDIIYTLHSVKRLFYSLTDCQIDWLYKTKNDILENQIEINKAIHYKEISSIKNQYDYIIDFGTKTNTLYLKYKLDATKIGFISQKKRFVSWFNDYSILLNRNKSILDNQSDIINLVCKIESIEIYDKEIILNYNQKIINKINLYIKDNFDLNKKIIAINPNSARIDKTMNLKQWKLLLDKIDFNYHNFVLIGAEHGDIGLKIETLINSNNYPIKILPNFSLLELSYLLKNIDLLISPDTSILHLAEFQKINVLGVYLGVSNELNMASWGNLENLKYQIFEFNVDKILNSFYSLT